MTKEQLFSYVDHTQLKAFATWEDIKIEQEWATWARDVFLKEGWKI